jgi:predicted transcriptional regulator
MTDNLKIELTSEIVSAYVGNNPLAQTDLPDLLRDVASTLQNLETPGAVVDDQNYEAFTSVKKSIKPDHLVCMDCGAKFKTLKRHIRTSHGLSVEEYKRRYNLPSDYPVVAPAYSEKRTSIAVGLGLGRKKSG